MKKKGTNMVTVEAAGAGDIISMAGLAAPAIGHTVANSEVSLYALIGYLTLSVVLNLPLLLVLKTCVLEQDLNKS
jgi:predicted membrane GTPase involved in stress response